PWELTAAPVPVHECDRLAASSADPLKPAQVVGVDFKKSDAKKALAACQEAVEIYDTPPRFAFQLGRAYEAGGNFREAVLWYRRAVEANYAAALSNLGDLYENGPGGLAKDEVEAVRLYQLAAAQGSVAGQTGLGLMYANGRGGLAKNDGEAVRL